MKWKKILVATDFRRRRFRCGGILDRERARKVDLIVIATHGRRGLDRALLGSVAEKVIRHTEAPVLVVPEGQGSEAAESLMEDGSRLRARRKKNGPRERTVPPGRRPRGPWTGHAHTGRGGPAGRRGGPSRRG